MGSMSNATRRSRIRSGYRVDRVEVADVVRGLVIEERPLPRAPVVGVEGRAAQAQRHAGRRERLARSSSVKRSAIDGSSRSTPTCPRSTLIGESDHATVRGVVQEQERKADAWEEDEERRGEEEDRDREQARREEKLPPDDAPASQDARDVDGQTRAVARALAVVSLDLAAQVAEDERARRDDEEPEEAESVREAPAENGAGHEVKEREHDDLLVVRGPPPRREADDLEHRGELDGDVEGGAPESEATDPSTTKRASGAIVAKWRRSGFVCQSSGIARASARPTRSTAFAAAGICAVLTTASTPSAASRSVMTRWTRPNLTTRPLAGRGVAPRRLGRASDERRRAGTASTSAR